MNKYALRPLILQKEVFSEAPESLFGLEIHIAEQDGDGGMHLCALPVASDGCAFGDDEEDDRQFDAMMLAYGHLFVESLNLLNALEALVGSPVVSGLGASIRDKSRRLAGLPGLPSPSSGQEDIPLTPQSDPLEYARAVIARVREAAPSPEGAASECPEGSDSGTAEDRIDFRHRLQDEAGEPIAEDVEVAEGEGGYPHAS